MRKAIALNRLGLQPLSVWDKVWFLLTAGDFASGDFNTMTVSWGSLGTLWNRPIAQVFVRPTRYTYEFMEKADDFTLSAFSDSRREALLHLGTVSGRKRDKIAEAGLTPMASSIVASPSFEEASLVLECRKIYRQDLDPTQFLDPSIEAEYPEKDYHRIYLGEVLAAFGVEG